MYTLSLLHSIQGLTQTTAQYDRYAHTYNPSLMHKCIIDTHGRRHEHAHTGALCCLHMQKLIVSGWFCFVIMRSLSLPPLSCLNGDTVQLCLGLQMTEGVCVCVCVCKHVCHFNPFTWTPTKTLVLKQSCCWCDCFMAVSIFGQIQYSIPLSRLPAAWTELFAFRCHSGMLGPIQT